MKLLPLLALNLMFAHPARAVDYLLVSQPATTNILRFNAQTGAAMGPFVASGSGGLTSPKGMTLGPDGNLYVGDAVANRVKRFSMVNGSPVGDGNFTAADVVFPVALKFDTNGDLLAMGGQSQRTVRRYNGITGLFVAHAAAATTAQLSLATDFLRMLNDDVLIVSGLNRGSRFSSSTTAFLSPFFINSTGDLNVMNQPRAILLGPDGNYWVTNRGSNRLTRYDSTTGAKLNDVVDGAPLNGPAGLIISGTQLYVSNQTGNNLLRYTITNAATGTLSAATELIPASAGLSAPEHILKVFIEDAPVAQAGVDVAIPGGEPFTLNGGTSSDPEGLALTYAWTQLSGLPLLANPPVTTAAVPLTAPFTTGSAVFQLVVTDPAGKTSTDSVKVTITAPLDTDNNGLPDRWEDTQPALTGGADDDDDGDGTGNYFEFLAGTSPTDPASFFKLIDCDLTPTAATLRFRSGSRNYQFQRSTNLKTWTPVPGHETVPGTGGVIEVTSPVATGFYRVAAKRDF